MVTASEEAALTLGSEELKNEQELARQDGKCKGRFRPRCQCRQNCRSVSFVHFAGRTLNAPSFTCWWRRSMEQGDHFVRER